MKRILLVLVCLSLPAFVGAQDAQKGKQVSGPVASNPSSSSRVQAPPNGGINTPLDNDEESFYQRAWPIQKGHAAYALLLMGAVILIILTLLIRAMAQSGPRKIPPSVFVLLAAAVWLFLPTDSFALGMGKWLPNLNDAYGGKIDSLYGLIFWIVTAVFFATEGAMLVFIFAFRKRPGHKAQYSHGNHWVEFILAAIPAIILVWLALYQKSLWEFIKADMPSPSECLTVQVFPEQFLWNIRYAGPDGKFGTTDDIMTINALHVEVGKKTVVHMSAKDVIHSFFIPYARVKQDAVPGMMGRLWFEIDKIPVWNLKTQAMEFLTLDEYNQKKVALTGFNLTSQILGFTGNKSYTYQFDTNLLDPKLDKKFRVVYVSFQGKVSAMDPAKAQQEAEYAQHPLEIACSQLCGLGHYRMVGHVTVETPETFDWWMKQAESNPANFRSNADRWVDIWDKYHPEYNNAE